VWVLGRKGKNEKTPIHAHNRKRWRRDKSLHRREKGKEKENYWHNKIERET